MKHRWKGPLVVAIRWLVRLEQLFAVGLLAAILLTMAAQVVARYVFQSPISWSEEVARLSMIWLTFVASGFVAARHQHIAVDLFGPRVDVSAEAGRSGPAKGIGSRGWSALVGWLTSSRLVDALVLSSTLLLLIGGLRFVWRVYPVGSPGTGISMTYWYGAASVGLALIAVHALADLLGIQQSDATSDD